MIVKRRGFVTWVAAAGGTFILSLSVTLSARAADDKTYVMKIALATLDDSLHQYAKNYAVAVENDSGGRIIMFMKTNTTLADLVYAAILCRDFFGSAGIAEAVA